MQFCTSSNNQGEIWKPQEARERIYEVCVRKVVPVQLFNDIAIPYLERIEACVAVGGASVSLVIGQFDFQRWAWAGAGAMLVLALLVLVWHTHSKMLHLWSELQKGGTP